MQWTDQAVVLSVRRLGEYSGVVHVLTRDHGVHAGVDRAAFGKRRQGVYQPGNIVEAHWQARLAEHIGTFSAELQDAVASRLLGSRRALAVLTSATQLVEKILPERDPHPEIYEPMQRLLAALGEDKQDEYLLAYVKLEYALLECAGFGLDLERCAATGQTHDLCYISPRSGRAVSREAGQPYHDRMFLLPDFLRGNMLTAELAALMDGLRLCGHFLQERVFTSRGAKLPVARSRLMGMLVDEKNAELV